MTGAGWVANMFSRDVRVEDYVGGGENGKDTANGIAALQPPSAEEYAHLPPQFQPTAQAIVNYRCHLAVMAQCQTPQQSEACSSTCAELSDAVRKELRGAVGGAGNGLDVEEDDHREAYAQLFKDLEEADQVRKRLVAAMMAAKQQSKRDGNSGARAPITPHNLAHHRVG